MSKLRKIFHKKNVLLSAIFFYAIFFPVFIKLPCQYIIMGGALVYIAIRLLGQGHIIVSKQELNVIYGFVPFYLYVLCISIMYILVDKGHSMAHASNIRGITYIYLYTILLYLALKIYGEKYRISKNDVFEAIILCSIIQLIFVVLSLAIPGLKSVIVNLIIKYSDDEAMANALGSYNHRAYGLANNLFDGFGYLISMLISTVFMNGVSKNNFKLIILSMSMIIIPLLNARSGVVLTCIGFFIVSLYYFDIKLIFRSAIVLVGVFIVLWMILSRLSEYTQAWLLRGFNDTLKFLNGDSSAGVYNQIFNEDLVLPSNVLLGDGGAPSLLKGLVGIDSGYIQCLWRYGIIGSIILGLGYYNFFLITLKNVRSKDAKCYISIIIVIFSLYLFKLFSITNYCGMTLTIVIPMLLTSADRINLQELTNHRIKIYL